VPLRRWAVADFTTVVSRAELMSTVVVVPAVAAPWVCGSVIRVLFAEWQSGECSPAAWKSRNTERIHSQRQNTAVPSAYAHFTDSLLPILR
jgi:hypothetical protein